VEPVILSVGEDEEVTIKQLADAVVKNMKFEGEYKVIAQTNLHSFLTTDALSKWDTTRADGQYRKPASNKKLLSLTGGFEFTPFEEGECILTAFLSTS